MQVYKIDNKYILAAFIKGAINYGCDEKKGLTGFDYAMYFNILKIVLAENDLRLPIDSKKYLSKYTNYGLILIGGIRGINEEYKNYLKSESYLTVSLVETTREIFEGYLYIKNNSQKFKKEPIKETYSGHFQNIDQRLKPLLRFMTMVAIEYDFACYNCQNYISCDKEKPRRDCILWKNDALLGYALSKTNLPKIRINFTR